MIKLQKAYAMLARAVAKRTKAEACGDKKGVVSAIREGHEAVAVAAEQAKEDRNFDAMVLLFDKEYDLLGQYIDYYEKKETEGL